VREGVSILFVDNKQKTTIREIPGMPEKKRSFRLNRFRIRAPVAVH